MWNEKPSSYYSHLSQNLFVIEIPKILDFWNFMRMIDILIFIIVHFEKAFLRHVLASQTLVQLVLPGMKEANYGRIINIISTSVKEPIVGLGVSNTIRGAMASWSKTFSKELPPSITINNVLPGFTATERLEELKQTLSKQKGISPNEVEKAWLGTVPEGRLADPSELGQVIAFLASPAASFVRGVSLPVDGGRTGSI